MQINYKFYFLCITQLNFMLFGKYYKPKIYDLIKNTL